MTVDGERSPTADRDAWSSASAGYHSAQLDVQLRHGLDVHTVEKTLPVMANPGDFERRNVRRSIIRPHLSGEGLAPVGLTAPRRPAGGEARPELAATQVPDRDHLPRLPTAVDAVLSTELEFGQAVVVLTQPGRGEQWRCL
jgi:hypothetical protein